MDDITKDFQDGIKLINLIEIITDKKLGKYNPQPKSKIHQITNLHLAVSEINKLAREVGVKVSYGEEQIWAGDRKVILGMLWILISKVEIQHISEEGIFYKIY